MGPFGDGGVIWPCQRGGYGMATSTPSLTNNGCDFPGMPTPSRKCYVVTMSHPPTQGLWPDESQGPWYFRLYWEEIDGRTECVGLDFRSVRTVDDEGSGSLLADPSRVPMKPTKLTTTTLRDFPLGATVDGSRAWVGAVLTWWAGRDEARRDELEAKARRFAARRSKGGRKPMYGPDHWAAVADVYLGTASKPTSAVAEAFGVSHSAAGKWVARCREMGLVPPTTAGKTSTAKPPRKRKA